jgi:para-nitrobenzyl esterase
LIPEPVIDGGDAPGCLAVNVFTPDPSAGGLPVLVWIHGGGFVSGTPSSPWYDGDRFAPEGIVVVCVGYRLGAEGFAAIPGAVTNRGVRDWIAALEWVQTNVAAFGGDPGKVTIGGQSAGGAAAMLLTTLPAARGLFRASIPMSGSVFPAREEDAAERLTVAMAEHLGVAATAAGLASVTPAALVEAQTAAALTGGRRPGALNFFPAVDGDLVPVAPMDAVVAGVGGALPMLIGANREEFTALERLNPTPDDRLAAAYGRMGLDEGGAARYRDNGGIGQAITDWLFRVPALRVAEARAGGPAPTFHYDFQWRSAELGGVGAVHCLDLPFVWNVLDDPHVSVVAGPAPPRDLADVMHAAWARFITDGDAGWAPFDPAARATMVFDETSKVVEDVPISAAWQKTP